MRTGPGWLRRGTLTGAAVAVVALGLSGCATPPERISDNTAATTAETIASYLGTDVVTPGLPAARQLEQARAWLADPPYDDAYARSFTRPDVEVLSADDREIDVVVRAVGTGTVFDGDARAWGHACSRFTVDTANVLQHAAFACPADVSRNPATRR